MLTDVGQAYYDFYKFGYEDANFIIDPEHWYMAARITRDGMWRVSYGVPASLTKEELLEQRDEKWRNMLPGNPSPEDYRITNFSPYKVHQRLAESMRVGPFVLAADAAHREYTSIMGKGWAELTASQFATRLAASVSRVGSWTSAG